MLALRRSLSFGLHQTTADTPNGGAEVWQSSLQRQQTDSLKGCGAEDEAKGEKTKQETEKQKND